MADHGTNAGYRVHWRAGEKACDACAEAHRAYSRTQKPTVREKLYAKASGRALKDLARAHRVEYHELLRSRIAELEAEQDQQMEAQADAVACEATPARLKVEQLIEDAGEMLAWHQTPAAIAQRLGKTPGALGKAFDRAGQHDLANLFEAQYKRKTVVCDADARKVQVG